MKNARDAIANIEETLNTTVAEAALKRDLNKMVNGLTDTVRQLVLITTELADALEAVSTAAAPAAKKAPPKVAAVKKAASKRTQKQVIKP